MFLIIRILSWKNKYVIHLKIIRLGGQCPIWSTYFTYVFAFPNCQELHGKNLRHQAINCDQRCYWYARIRILELLHFWYLQGRHFDANYCNDLRLQTNSSIPPSASKRIQPCSLPKSSQSSGQCWNSKKINPQKCWGNADKKEKDLSKSRSYVLHSILLPKLMFMWPSGVIFIMISEGK